jgi:hypothetical protein|tara:strand:+ start:163 stop:582 length:420 start_codon:yes stop_codon:yes gene_type:complete
MIAREEILAKFKKVYKSGEGEYQCLCPSHDDNNASLGLKFKEDKMILNCFAGCSMQSILDSVGLTWNDVMPNTRDIKYKPNSRIKFSNPYSILKATRDDLLFVAVCSSNIRKGIQLADSDNKKLFEITGRLRGLYDDIR